MPIHIVEKNAISENKQPKIVKTLSSAEEKSFISFFALRDSLLSYDKRALHQLSADVYAKDQWLMCGCAKNNPPLFRLNRSSKGKLYLCHLTKRGEHTDDCPLKFTISDKSTSTKVYKPSIKKTGTLNLVTPFATGIAVSKNNKNKEGGIISSATRRPKLASNLFRILETAGVNRCQPKSETSPTLKLFKAISTMELVKGISLKDYMSFFYKLETPDEPSKMLKYDKKIWPRNHPKHALMFVNITKFEGNTLYCTNRNNDIIPVQVEDKINLSSGRFGQRTPPYMGLILYKALPSSPNDYKPSSAFIIPRYNERSLIPVDSYYEREVLKKLMGLQLRLKNKGVLFEIEKPLFDKEVIINDVIEYALPDFIIYYQGKRIIIEVNGSIEPEYLARKIRTHKIMSYMGEVLSFNAIEADKNEGTLISEIRKFVSLVESRLC